MRSYLLTSVSLIGCLALLAGCKSSQQPQSQPKTLATTPDGKPAAKAPAPLEPHVVPTLSDATYGNQVATFFPGQSAQDAIEAGLNQIHSDLSIDGIDTLGYPAYSLECEKNGQCVNGTGTPFGSVADNAKQMFPVNPADVQLYGLECNVICHDGQGQIIGRDPNFRG